MSNILDKDLEFPHQLIVPASAGSGKTTALTQRLVQLLLSERVKFRSFRNILAITFTNNAAREMKRRVIGLLKKVALGEKGALDAIIKLVPLQADVLRGRARAMVDDILESYSEFQVQTFGVGVVIGGVTLVGEQIVGANEKVIAIKCL